MRTPQGYTIEAAGPEHIPFLNGIELEAATMFPPGSIPPQIVSDVVPESVLVEAMESSRLWVALDADSRPVGYALLQYAGALALLAQIDVLPAHARQGLGRALVLAVVEGARKNGAAALYLTTFTHVPWNAPFYSHMGFAEMPEKDLPLEMQEILAEERDRGLENREALRLSLAG